MWSRAVAAHVLLLCWVPIIRHVLHVHVMTRHLSHGRPPRVQADTPGAVLLTGDLSYADDYDELNRYGYQPRWDIWGRLTQAVFANVPLIAGIGAFVNLPPLFRTRAAPPPSGPLIQASHKHLPSASMRCIFQTLPV